ncbi:hypothetical protein LCGC14_1154950 [marine sediment metagenome]|uniref:Helicase HerA central domain-containing protein n=1 Tax=marine sediment metagenome TaxID=412755 RepID=A0A0F9MHG8_9ZZZZ|nr:ATP-binding protein [bacterium]
MIKMPVEPSFQTLIEDEKNEWICKNLFPLLSILNIGEGAFQSGRFNFTFPLSKENLIENLNRITNKHQKLINKELSKFDEVFKKYFDIKIISNDEKYKHVPRGSKNSYWHAIDHCNSSKDSEIFYILKDQLTNESRKDLENLKFNPDLILKSIIQNVRSIEDLLYLAILKFATLENQYREKYAFRHDLGEEGNDLNILLLESEIDEELTEYFSSGKIIDYESGKHNFKLGLNRLLRLLGKTNQYYATLYTHSFVGTSCVKVPNILLEQNIAKEIYEKLDRFPFEKWFNDSYNEIKNEIIGDENNLPLFEYQSRFKLLKWISESSQPCIFDIEDDQELIQALDSFKKSKILNQEGDNIVIINEIKFNEKFNQLKSKDISKIEKNKRKLLTRWLKWRSDLFIESLGALTEEPTITPISPPLEPLIAPISPPLEPPIEQGALKILLGRSDQNTRNFWEPGSLNNGHFIILGGSGAGKTELIRCITSELDKQGYPVLLIDFHGDMACKNCRILSYKLKEGSEFYFNPFELNPKFKEITPLRATDDFIDAININFPSLGIQQRDALRNIILKAFSQENITREEETWKNELKFEIVENKIKNSNLKAYLNMIIDYELFKGNKKITIKDILENNITHLNLTALPESLKFLFSDLFLRKLFYSLQSIGEIPPINPKDKEKFRIFIIVDEAKLLVSQNQRTKAVLNKYASEIRKYGASLILASQLISHFNEEILSNISLKMCMKAENKEQAKINDKYFGVGRELLLNLKLGEGILVIGDTKNKIKIIPSWER